MDVYVLDSGVRTSHVEFGGRAVLGATFVGQSDDKFGHGTHVSGTIAGGTVGVAPRARVIGVKVIYDTGEGPVSAVIMGVDWAIRQAMASGRPSVINMSMGTKKSQALDYAVLSAIRRNILVVASAGNDAKDACLFSPADLSSGLTVGSTDYRDTRSTFSNYGSCVKIYAPGSYIRSASFESDTGYRILNGTSMAAPHVTGAAAVYLSRYPFSQPAQTIYQLLAGATPIVTNNPDGTNTGSRLLFLDGGASRTYAMLESLPRDILGINLMSEGVISDYQTFSESSSGEGEENSASSIFCGRFATGKLAIPLAIITALVATAV